VGDVPARFDRHAVDAHCAAQRAVYQRYRMRWLALATPFFFGIRPKVLPHRVVYPFGGGDLVTALTVFPDADEFTTISMEAPGDVRLVDSVTNSALHPALSLIGRNVRKLLGFSYSNTVNLGSGERAALPGEIALHFAGLVVHGYEPIGLRYFTFELDGSLHYLTADEITTREASPASASPFANVEIRFARPGTPGTVKTLRHVEQDLSNHGLGLTPGLKRYLEARGEVAAMTKAASHLLWSDDFSVIRTYLQEHIVWMASDSTGLPPRFAEASGLRQTPYGIFEGPAPFGPIEALDGRAFRHLFESNPKRPLGFRFGYGDKHKRAHLIVTERPATAAAAK
jgi:hypothetical protein